MLRPPGSSASITTGYPEAAASRAAAAEAAHAPGHRTGVEHLGQHEEAVFVEPSDQVLVYCGRLRAHRGARRNRPALAPVDWPFLVAITPLTIDAETPSASVTSRCPPAG